MDEASLEDDAGVMESDSNIFDFPFLPPPPRPLFLEESVTTDGLTTCDLCSWAQKRHDDVYGYDNTSREVPAGLGWVLTLVIVSLTSALIGAIIMIVVLHCKRMKTSETNDNGHGGGFSLQHRPPISTPDDKEINTIGSSFQHNSTGAAASLSANNSGVWSWLSKKSTGSTPCQLEAPTAASIENHYTHMDDGYNTVDEALYAELDRESCVSNEADIREGTNNSPAYQNSAYTDPDLPTSSAPSSAYYSDLSTTTLPDRAYEIVGLTNVNTWENRPGKLAAISENIGIGVPSDYV